MYVVSPVVRTRWLDHSSALSSSWRASNSSRADLRFSMISAARISGSGRFSSLIHVMSRLALSRRMSSS